MENKNINTHNVTILSEFPLFGERGNVTFSLSEYNDNLGIKFEECLQPVLGRVVGKNYIYLFGFKVNDSDLAFIAYDSKHRKTYRAYYDYNTFTIAEIGQIISNLHVFRANYDVSEDYNYNLPWFNSIKRKIELRKSLTPEMFVFYENVINSNGAKLVNSLVDDYKANLKDFMLLAMEYYMLKFGYHDTKRAIKDIPLVKRLSLMKIIDKMFDRNTSSRNREKAIDKFMKIIKKMSVENVQKIYLMLEKDYEVDQVFDDFKTTLMHDMIEESVFGNNLA